MSAVLGLASAACSLAGLVAAGAVLARGRDPRQALGVLLDFLLAAGLLRLSLPGLTWTSLATVAVVVVVRKGVVTFGLGQPSRGRRP